MLFTSFVESVLARKSLVPEDGCTISKAVENVTSSQNSVCSRDLDSLTLTASPVLRMQAVRAAGNRFIEITPISPISFGQPSNIVTHQLISPIARKASHPAVERVLNSPELLFHIFSFLENSMATSSDPTQPIDFVRVESIKYTLTTPKLLSSLFVNKIWNACATPIMYRNTRIGSEAGCTFLRRTLMESSIAGHNYGLYMQSFVFVTPSNAIGETDKWDLNGFLEVMSGKCSNMIDVNLSGCSMITDKTVASIAQGCPQLRRFNLNRCDLLTSASVNAIADAKLALTSLNLSRPIVSPRALIDDESLSRVIDASPDLVELRLRNCNNITDKTALKIGERCKNLMALDLSWCGKLSDRSLSNLGINCGGLRSVALNGCKKFTDGSLKILLANSPQLASLSLSHLTMMTDDVIVSMAPMLKNLSILSLNGCSNVRDASIVAMAKACPKMESLSLFSIDIGDESVRAITQYCPQIYAFSISGCERVTNAGAMSISKLSRLQSLYLNASQVTDICIEGIVAHCKSIKALSLNECVNLTDGALAAIASNLHRLQSLSINRCSITQAGAIALIGKCKELREISARHCENVSDGPWIGEIRSRRRLAILVGNE